MNWPRRLITDWHYDDGTPHYFSVIDTWSSARTPSWRCVLWPQPGMDKVTQWLNHNGEDPRDYEGIVRYNSGDPMTQIMIYNGELATAFALTFADDLQER
jgi:hypothetical protein